MNTAALRHTYRDFYFEAADTAIGILRPKTNLGGVS